uniref:RNA-directed RNA polymerase n=1 Tax=Leviviridae sp. TaxID=2027243 RepID=A0A514DB23_9VIRU|nr:MAG: RNA-dependent RNA polymerase [Leviviridae sp.]
MESMLNLLLCTLEESGVYSGIDTTNDRKTIISRFEQEGDSFLTITMPSIVKDLYRALDDKKVTPGLFPSFKRKRGEMLPVFLGGFFRVLFDPYTGLSRDYADAGLASAAVRHIIQISGLCGKLFEQASPKRTAAALERYISNDAMVSSLDDIRERLLSLGIDVAMLRVAAHEVFGKVFNEINREIARENLRPHHGPGAVADKLFGNEKWQQPPWPARLEAVFPYGRWAYNSWLNYLDDLDNGNVADPGAEIPVKVITVPKTQKTPRIIAIEPTCMQYMQQALCGCYEEALRHDPVAYTLVGYDSQEPNQLLARKGSYDGSLATLDLSDASDLVSNELVDYVLTDWPHMRAAWQATRSQYALVNTEGGDISVALRKFASMGSALCFPTESMIFLIITLLGISRVRDNSSSLSSLAKAMIGSVRVYGDDIIVPTNCAQSVVDTLEACGLKVNRAKSFWNGNFRESCGKEYWNGVDVTYVKLRHQLPTLQRDLSKDVDSTIHTVAFRNNMLSHGRLEVVRYLDLILEKRLNGCFPVVYSTSSALGRHDESGHQPARIDSNLQRPLIKAYVVSAVSPISRLDGYAALNKCLVNDSELPILDPDHLIRSGRPVALRLKLRWVPIY